MWLSEGCVEERNEFIDFLEREREEERKRKIEIEEGKENISHKEINKDLLN